MGRPAAAGALQWKATGGGCGNHVSIRPGAVVAAAVHRSGLLRQLAGMGNNLNQIARKINGGQWSGADRVQVVAALMAIDAELERLRHAVLEKGQTMTLSFIREGEAAVPGLVDYLLVKTTRDGAIVLQGKPEEVRELIDASPYAKNTSGVLSFAEQDLLPGQRES